MGKRSNFERKERDFYPTPREAVEPLRIHLPREYAYAEPCAGDGALTDQLSAHRIWCFYMGDIEPQDPRIKKKNALEITEKDVRHCDYIITNPPWTRSILHPLITHFRHLKPTWLLFDGPWAFTKQAVPYLKYCSDIVVVGRLKWIPGSKYTSKDDCAWYKFVDEETTTTFHGKV